MSGIPKEKTKTIFSLQSTYKLCGFFSIYLEFSREIFFFVLVLVQINAHCRQSTAHRIEKHVVVGLELLIQEGNIPVRHQL